MPRPEGSEVLRRVDGREARIGIRAAGDGPPVAGIDARPGEAVITSGTYERYLEIGGRHYAHVLDPGTGQPVGHTVSVTVIHTDPVLADAAATALLVGAGAILLLISTFCSVLWFNRVV